MNNPTLIFDLGGVFIELTGVETMMEWTQNRLSVDELWATWIASDHVKLFETGQTNELTFAQGMIKEFDLPVSTDEFLFHFSSWANRLFPGSRKLLTQLKQSYTLVSLSNTNVIHWDNLCDQFDIDRYFHFNFPSHMTGKIKPDLHTFTHVISELSTPPDQLFFFDDNPDNIANAKHAGLNAHQVVGLTGLNEALSRLSLV